MSLTNFPNGILATPNLGGTSDGAGWFDTNLWYVDGDNGSDSNAGSMTKPFATIQKAIDSASSQDTIYVRTLAPDADASEPGTYVEDLTIAYAKHGLKLIGVGGTNNLQPFGGPKIKNATATALLTVNASNVLIKGLQFNCTRNSGTYGINLTGVAGYATLAGSVGAVIEDCYFKNASATYGAIFMYGGYTSRVTRCTFALGTDYLGVKIDCDTIPSNGHTVEYCNFKQNNGTSVANYMLIAGGAEDITVNGCTFGESTNHIIATGAPSGVISNCTFGDDVATLANSTGKIQIPATQTMQVTGCWGGVSLAVIQSAA